MAWILGRAVLTMVLSRMETKAPKTTVTNTHQRYEVPAAKAAEGPAAVDPRVGVAAACTMEAVLSASSARPSVCGEGAPDACAALAGRTRVADDDERTPPAGYGRRPDCGK